MGFNWLFAIIAGGFILFLAIYASTKLITRSESTQNTEIAARLISFLDPMETGLASGKSSVINFRTKSKTYFTCKEVSNPPFGKQEISFTDQPIGAKYGETGESISIYNKYVFVDNGIEGKSYFIFSVPFSMPYKVADIIILSANNYCFYNAPEEVVEDIEGLNIKNVVFANSSSKCSGINVCFQGLSECDVRVNLQAKYVEKEGKKLYYIDNLIYGAIFASPEIYECNVKRLMKKFVELGGVYIEKIKIIERNHCYSNIQPKLEVMMVEANKLSSSKALLNLDEKSKEIDQINKGAYACALYS